MRQRAFVHFAGGAGAGKTTLIERLLESNRSKCLIAVRAEQVEGLPDFEESASRRDPELGRYREAGAWDAVRYRFPPESRSTDAFWCTEFMESFSHGVLIEGELPIVEADLSVYITGPLPTRRPLLSRTVVDHTRAHIAELESLQRVASDSATARSFMDVVARFVAITPGEGQLEQFQNSAGKVLETIRAEGPPPPAEQWILDQACRGIELAQVVAVNVRGKPDRSRADGMLHDMARLRKDRQVFDDVIGWRGNRLPITARAADLTDPSEAGLRQLLARIKRVFPRG